MQGIQGPIGPEGPKGEKGDPGAIQSVNGKTATDLLLSAGDVGAYTKEEVINLFSLSQHIYTMSIKNCWESPLSDDDGAWILDDDGFILLADWKYKEA